jgi:hypothetical protein
MGVVGENWNKKTWKRAKIHLVFHGNLITQCGKKTRNVQKSMGEKERITCGNCLRWMNSKTGRKLGWGRKACDKEKGRVIYMA